MALLLYTFTQNKLSGTLSIALYCITVLGLHWSSGDGNGSQSPAILYSQHHNNIASKQLKDDFNVLNHLNFSKISKVLDLGCGTGNITSTLAERVGPKGVVTGVDPDKERIEVAMAENQHSNVTFFVGNEQTFPKDQYDLVFCRYVTHWISNKQAVFQNVSKNLQPGGTFVIIAIIRPAPVSDEISQLMSKEGQTAIDEMFDYCPSEVYDQLAIDNGFSVTLKEEDFDIMSYPTPDDALKAWMAITHGAVNPELADQDALARFREKYSGHPIDWKLTVTRYILTKQ